MISRWRVIAIRRNGSRIVLDEYLRRVEADQFKNQLELKNLFPSVFIEPDGSALNDSAGQPLTAGRDACLI